MMGNRNSRCAFFFLIIAGFHATASGCRAQEASVAVVSINPGSTRPLDHLSTGRRIGAAVVSAYVGLGTGETIIHYNSRATKFLIADLSGITLAFVGIAKGFSGDSDHAGESIFYTGAGVYLASRVLQFADVVVTPFIHNGNIEEYRSAHAGVTPPRIIPVVNPRTRTVGVAVMF